MDKKVLSFIRENNMIEYGDKILVALSGGPDSMALMHLLISIKSKWDLKIYACHINHKIRGSAAAEDQRFVENYCKSLSIPYYIKESDVPNLAKEKGITIEEAGREVRYGFFDQLINKLNIQRVALAHHEDDQVETILMRILRGTGIKGMRGILPVREAAIIRPLLCVKKDEILLYLKENSIPSVIDKTNFEPIYHRNRIRLELLPYLEKISPNIKNHLIHLSNISSEYYDFLKWNLKKEYHIAVQEGKVRISYFNSLHPLLKKEILIKYITSLLPKGDIGYEHINKIVEKMEIEGDTTWSMDIPKGKIMRSYDYLILKSNKKILQNNSFSYTLLTDKVYLIPKADILIEAELCQKTSLIEKKEQNTGYFDYDKIIERGSMILRNRKNGDRISPVGLDGSKKLKDIFIDKKVPLYNRNSIPLLCAGDHIIWILGYHKSRDYLINNRTKRVLKISYNNIRRKVIE